MKRRDLIRQLEAAGYKKERDNGGANGDRCLRQKQGAVSGAALRFLQAGAVSRRKNRLSARGKTFLHPLFLPRHRELNENTAKSILRTAGLL